MIYIGIDTGTHTGVAVWDSQANRLVECSTMPLHRALHYVWLTHQDQPVTVIVEDARQRQWLPREKSESQYRGRLMGAGSVKRDAVIWEEFLTDLHIPFVMQPPRKGATKWSEEMFRTVTGWEGRTSNHARDAALLVFGR